MSQQNYLLTKSPVETDTCPGEFRFQNGVCVDELTVDACHPIRDVCEPPPVPCVGDYCNAFYEKLCEISEGIAGIEIDVDLPEAAGVTKLGCVREDPANPKSAVIGCVLVCKIEDQDTGVISYKNVMVPVDGGVIVDPYEGPFDTDCGPAEYQPVDLWVSDPDSPFCDYRIYECEGDKYTYNPTTCEYEILPMGIQTTPYQPTDELVCREAQYGAYELAVGATDVATIVADILAANPLTYDVNGTAIAVEAADIDYIKITPKACGTFNSAGDEILVDFVNVNGVAASNLVDLSEGGVDGATAIEVPPTGCAVVDVCFKKCWSKQEVATLGA